MYSEASTDLLKLICLCNEKGIDHTYPDFTYVTILRFAAGSPVWSQGRLKAQRLVFFHSHRTVAGEEFSYATSALPVFSFSNFRNCNEVIIVELYICFLRYQ